MTNSLPDVIKRTVYQHPHPYVNALSLHPTEPLLAMTGSRLIALFDMDEGEIYHVFEPQITQELQYGFGCDFSPTGEQLAVSYYGGVVEIFSTHDRRPLHHLQLICGTPFISRRVAYIPGSGPLRLCFIGTDGQIILWDQETERIVWRYRSQYGSFCDFTLDQQGCHIFAVQTSWGEQNHLTIHEVETGIMRQVRLPSLMWAVACTADGSRLALGGQRGDVYLYETASMRELARWQGGPVTSMRFGPDDRALFVLRTKAITRIDAASGKEETVWSDDLESLYALAIHPESQDLFVAGLKGTVRSLTLPESGTAQQTLSFADAAWPPG